MAPQVGFEPKNSLPHQSTPTHPILKIRALSPRSIRTNLARFAPRRGTFEGQSDSRSAAPTTRMGRGGSRVGHQRAWTAPLQPFRARKLAEFPIERPEGQMARLACHLKHQAVRKADRGLPLVLLQSNTNDVGVLQA